MLVDVVVTQTGYSGRTVTVYVEDEGRIVGSEELQLPADGSPATAQVRAAASEAGPRLFKFRVAPLPDEMITQNNVREALIDVRDDREKILYFEGEPRFEMKFLRRAVADDENLRVVALQRTADNKFLRLDVDDPDELLGGFPRTREELFSYRALILGSIEAGAFTGDQLQMIADFVDRRGGGLLMIGGARSFGEGGYGGTPVADALPLTIDPGTRASEPAELARLQILPTRAGENHASTQIAATEGASAARWRDLPQATSVNAPLTPKPAAIVLLTGTDERGREQPVLTWHQYGRGKAVALTLQDTWQWQMHASIPLEDLTHEHYWRQMLRWLVNGVPGVVEARATTERVEPGEAVTVEAAVVDKAHVELNDASVTARVTRPNGGTIDVPLEWTGRTRRALPRNFRQQRCRYLRGRRRFLARAGRRRQRRCLRARRPERRGVLRPDDARGTAAADCRRVRRTLLHARHGGRPRGGCAVRRPRRDLGRRARSVEHADHPLRADEPGVRRVGISSRGGSLLMLRAFLLIVVGLAGDPEHGELFQKWGSALAEASESIGVASERLVYLSDAKEDARVRARATREEIDSALSVFAQAAAPDDVVYVVLVGHGSYDGRTARFNLPGPDMTPADFDTLLRKLPARNVVFVNTSSSSGPFLEELSGPGRTIITATRNGAERFTTLFGGYFVEAFSTDASDADKNKRVSMLEAFQYAKNEVERAYEREGLLATEHALLDDNGDKKAALTPRRPARRAELPRRCLWARLQMLRRCQRIRHFVRCISNAGSSSGGLKRCGC